MLSQEYAPIWHSWTPERRERHINDFRTAAQTLEQMFVKPVNARRKPRHQLRMRQENEPSVPPSASILVLASTETATISLSSPVTSTLASSQASSSQCKSFEDPRHGRETIFELHLRSELPKKISRCRGNCHKTITQSDRLLVRLYGINSWFDPKTGKERSRHGPMHIHFQDNFLKAYDSQNCYAPNELFNYQQIKLLHCLFERSRNKLSQIMKNSDLFL